MNNKTVEQDQKSFKFRRYLRRLRRPAWLGTLRRLAPLSDSWGFDRGTPIDRYYIERFLEEHRRDISGRVLEMKDGTYTDRFGMDVEQRDVLDIKSSNVRATFVADLATADAIPSDLFDCFILTQTLQFIYDTRACLRQAYRILRPDGVLLVTVPCISRIAPRYGLQMDFWRFTIASCSTLFGDVFGQGQVSVNAYGNVLTAVAFMEGMAWEELSHNELETHDPYFPILITVRAVKQTGGDPLP